MARNGSGAYSLPQAAFQSGTTVDETKVNSNFSDIASALTASIAKDGQTTPTANLPMGTNKHTGVGDATAADQYAAFGQVQGDEASWAGTSAGTADVQTITPAPAITAYAAGQRFRFIAGSGLTNTGACTLNVSAVGAKNVKALDGTDPDAGAITDGNVCEVVYDGTNMVLLWATTPASARLFMGLGTAALTDTGVSNGNVPAMDATGYPAADGSQITALAGANLTAGSVPLTALASQAANTFVMNATGAGAVPTAGTAAQALASLGIESYDSGEQSLPSTGATLQVAHGFSGSDHVQADVYLKCTTTDGGWAVGDYVKIPPAYIDGSSEFGFAVSHDTTNFNIVRGANSTPLYNKGTGAQFTITDSSWRVVVFARRFAS